MHIEPHPLLKLLWFVRNPLPNALALFGLRDRFATQPWFWVVTAAFAGIVALGFRYGASTRSQKLRWLFCALALPFVAHSVSLAASSQAIGYRTLLPLSGLFLVLVVFALRAAVRSGRLPAHGPGRCARRARADRRSARAAQYLHADRRAAAPRVAARPLGRRGAATRARHERIHHQTDDRRSIDGACLRRRVRLAVVGRGLGGQGDVQGRAAGAISRGASRTASYTASRPIRCRPTRPSQYNLVLDMRRLKTEGDRVLVAVGEAAANALRR